MTVSVTALKSTVAALAHEGGIGEIIISAIGRYPNRVAFVDGDRSITYTELERLVGKAMAAFSSMGLQCGDGVMQISGNRVEVFVVMAAAYLLGLRSVTLHAMGGYDDHVYIVNDADPSVFISEQAFQQRSAALRAGYPGVPQWFAHGPCEGLADFWELAGTMEPAPLAPHAASTDIIRLAYTGGTTGKPKRVMLAPTVLYGCRRYCSWPRVAYSQEHVSFVRRRFRMVRAP